VDNHQTAPTQPSAIAHTLYEQRLPTDAADLGDWVRNEDEFRDFVRQRWTALTRTAYLLTGDKGHAEDLVQTSLERLHRRWNWVDDPERYTRRILANEASARWRRRATRPETITDSVPESEVPDAEELHDERDRLWRALANLPRRTRVILVLRYFEDLTEAECAAVLQCSVGSVKSQASRGLAWLRADAGIDRDNGGSNDAPWVDPPTTSSRGVR
jgi:RNA polymerase sigma-70 factor (sigma-E family)